MLERNGNPDVLTLLSNLNNDLVFTPPNIAYQMLDNLPTEIWTNEKATFLDPVTKSGVFLREITRRLDHGLKNIIPDKKKRLEHIFHNQVFGLGTTELTSQISRRTLYCSREANGKYSVGNFQDSQGNIKYIETKHFWADGKNCKYCGLNKHNYDREKELESYAFPFIHDIKINEVFNMKFDVIIGNPPYTMQDGGSGKSAQNIYHKFVEQAKKLDPTYLIMIIPARWYIGGKGLFNFRNEMLNDKKIKKIVDFESASEVFPGVDIPGGVCYFLRDKFHNGDCEVVNFNKNERISSIRKLNEFQIFIRRKEAISIIKKVQKWKNENNAESLSQVVSPRKPFGLPTNYKPTNSGVQCYFIKKIGKKYARKSDIKIGHDLIDKWKVLLPKAPIAGQTDFSKPVKFYHHDNVIIAEPGTCCTESWIIAASFSAKEEALNFRSYLFTKTFRFLLLQSVISQDVIRGNFKFIPAMKNYKNKLNDKNLKKMWKFTQSEWKQIDERILSIE